MKGKIAGFSYFCCFPDKNQVYYKEGTSGQEKEDRHEQSGQTICEYV